MSDIAARLAEAQASGPKGHTIGQLIDSQQDRLVSMIGGWSLGQLRRAASVAVAADARLLHVQAESLLGALLRCAQVDLEPGPLEHVYITAGGDGLARFLLGYKGILALARRSPAIQTIDAQVVYEADDFAVTFGSDGKLYHRLEVDDDRGDARAWYCYARLTNGGETYRVLTKADADYRRSFAEDDSDFWTRSYDAMALKSAIRAAEPFLPLDDRTATVVALDGGAFDPDGEQIPPVETEDGSGPDPDPETPQRDAGDGSGNSTVTDTGEVGSFVEPT